MSAPERMGVVLVDKPVGPTSHDVVARARTALGTRRIGHTGTLDPFASGLMLLCVGRATRLSPYLTGLDKSYEAEAVLGVTTETLDCEGAVVDVRPGANRLTRAEIEEALTAFRGPQMQVPPIYSAKKVAGEAAHRRARRGEIPDLEPVRIVIHDLALIDLQGVRLRFRVDCGSGTYVRALARDLGERLGVGAHLAALRRISVGAFTVDEAVAIDDLGAAGSAPWMTASEALGRAEIPRVEVDEDDRDLLAQGRPVRCPSGRPTPDQSPVAAVRSGELVAIGEVVGGSFRPRRVFVGP